MEIRRIVKDEGVDLLVLSNLSAPFAYVLLDQLQARGVPWILDLPDYFPTSAAGYIAEVNSFNGRLIAGVFDHMLRYITHRANAVTTASRALLRYARRCGAHDAHHVPNGIPEEFLRICDERKLREKLGFAHSDFVVGYVGSVDFWLDLKKLLRGMRLARDRGMNVKGLIIGKGLHNQEYSRKTTKWIEKEGLERDVVRLDFVPHGDVPRFVSALDVGTIPFDVRNLTAYYSAPIKIWEYFSQMKPVVSTPIPEALSNVDSVLIASDPFDYVRHFYAISMNDSEISRKIKIGHERACQRTWDMAASEFANVCVKVLKESGRKMC